VVADSRSTCETPLVLKPHGADADQERTIVIDRAPFWVGRRPENDYQIVRSDISGRHAAFSYDDGSWWVTDNGSTNGTFVNAHRVESSKRVRINVGDVLYFATKGYVVVCEADDSANRSLFNTKVLGDSTNIRGVMQLIRIINEQRTYPYFQPIIDLELEETVGWEALGRASTEDGPLTPAQAFFLAQHNRVESKLSRRFRESAVACGRCHHCWGDTQGLMLFLNLHTAEIPDSAFIDSLKDLADAEFRRYFRIVVEMPESWVCKTEEMRKMTQQIRALGMQVAYDDFGVGQSRLTDLREVPPDFVKLDRQLVQQAAVDRVQYDLVKAIVDACRKMQIRTLGEGIETKEELAACRSMRVNLGQGYYFSKPLPAYELFHKNTRELPNHCQFVRLDLLPRREPLERPSAAARGVAQPG
jgi:EAL domain-containing protein (putative c-di-GMP-specific phosphodiesterase class I)